ncbi:hypothetical protein GNI_142970 [Gregarina niphandrodes]|uniref:Uncharacterized protein n=1 Tax=Gregarina niphandrodes TaxID=110365 RepID=A0A023B006_GRENI|nr:hypothetical protein GNI_142970 [Gregarina niphandrodes]EZG44856.1 hypothetical protein GNI_142970 [Gregarina niphandrodes]|eukprot:XP_011132640.1 hypothetical protein GNI_142970 [Gregarina niphandrodes]
MAADSSMALLDTSLLGDMSSVYTQQGMVEGSNALVMPMRRSKKAAKPPALEKVKKQLTKRSLRAHAKMEEKARLKRLTKCLQTPVVLTAEQNKGINLLSRLMDAKSLNNETFESIYNEAVQLGIQMPDAVRKRHEKIQQILMRRKEEEDQDMM